jgi:peroxiredoxin Q/BCP
MTDSGSLLNNDQTTMLTKNDSAPLSLQFSDEQGTEHALADYAGSWVVLYFYPKDNTPGCTIEAEGFRDMTSEFEKEDVRILGVSKDTCASHKSFIEKKGLTFTLIADEDHALMDAFGVWGERSFMGRKYMGTSRSTFLIDPSGTIACVWEKVRPLGHAKEVLEMVREIKSRAGK